MSSNNDDVQFRNQAWKNVGNRSDVLAETDSMTNVFLLPTLCIGDLQDWADTWHEHFLYLC